MRKTSIGGQAVLEGVMLRGKKNWVVAVRRPDQTIAVEERKTLGWPEKAAFLRWYFFRGVVQLLESLILGIRALSISAQESTEEDVQISGRDMTISVVLAIVVAVGLFVVVPVGLVRAFDAYVEGVFLSNVLEGLVRILIFFGYILGVSRIKDISRVFEYHGAEHKVIHAYEAEGELSPRAAAEHAKAHVACGTSFMLLVMIVSVFVFSLLGKPPLLLRIVSRLLVIPIVAGISYEIIKLARRFQRSVFTRVLMWPGLLLQRLTTREPSPDQIEVALTSLERLLRLEAPDENESKAQA